MATLKEIIEQADKERLNAYDTDSKIKWVDTVNKFAHLYGYKLEPGDYIPLTSNDMDKELLITEPYTDAYVYFIFTKIDMLNNEMQNYNNSAQLYNQMWDEYLAYMIREGYINPQPTFKHIEP